MLRPAFDDVLTLPDALYLSFYFLRLLINLNRRASKPIPKNVLNSSANHCTVNSNIDFRKFGKPHQSPPPELMVDMKHSPDSVTRRKVLQGGLAVAGAMAAAGSIDAATCAKRESEAWKSLVGQSLNATEIDRSESTEDAEATASNLQNHRMTLRDVAVVDRSHEQARPNQVRSTSIVLQLESSTRPNFNNLNFSHPRFGQTELLVTEIRPLGVKPGCFVFEAILN